MEMNEYTEQFLFSGRGIRRKRQSGATYRKQEHRRLDIPKYSGEERTLRIEYRLSKIEGIMFFRIFEIDPEEGDCRDCCPGKEGYR